ncbi:MAG: DUF5110 domain-containing protein [Lachnospiraceae bacterium]|nr:DUF5110 domain-containing protein [Lachnospiraceae bacterium]
MGKSDTGNKTGEKINEKGSGPWKLRSQAGEFSIVPVTSNIIKCSFHPERLKEDRESMLVETGKNNDKITYDIFRDGRKENNRIIIDSITADIDLKDFSVKWSINGESMLCEGPKDFKNTDVMVYTTGDETPVIERVKTVDGERNFIKNLKEVKDHTALCGKFGFRFDEGEEIHGLGQGEGGIYDYRGHRQYLYQHNMRIPMPMLVSSKGYGLLFDCTSLMIFNDVADTGAEACESGSYLYLDAVDQLEYYFIYGPSMDEIIAGFRYLTGDAALLPKWSFGYIQSKEQYYSAKELVEVARRYRDLGVPIDCVVQDWNSWEKDKWGNKLLDPERFGDMEERSQELHRLNVHSMVSVWPNMNSNTENYAEFEQAGMLLNDLATYNAFDQKARKIYWRQAKEGLFDRGFDSFWCDSTEPFSGPDWGGEKKRPEKERYELVGGEHKKYLPRELANAYALAHARGIFENQRETTKEKRVLNLTRSGYASGQKYSAMLWSGDTFASWETLKRQITEGLNMGLSGYPYWTLDIGGFFTVGKKWQNRGCGCNNDPTPKWFWQGKYDDGVKDNGYKELYVRWLQMGCFLPMFRSHGTDTPREIWNFGKEGEPVYDAIAKTIRLRYRLMPYIYSLAGAVRLSRATMLRSLLFDFPKDKRAAAEHQEFLFGKELLICPVTEPMYYEAENRKLSRKKEWTCYLPKGVDWYDFRTGKFYPGGQEITVPADISSIPVFVRAGSILPTKEGLSYAAEENGEPLSLTVYPGADGEMSLYEDDGETYGYETGEYSVIPLTWEDEKGRLTIGKREGGFSGMEKTKTIEITFFGKPEKTTILYTGSEAVGIDKSGGVV